MAGRTTLRSELQAQQRVIDGQRIEIERQRRQMELQFRRTADIQVQIDRIQLTLQQAFSMLHPTQAPSGNGNGHGYAAGGSSPRKENVGPPPRVI
jgi:hypothetical protein